MPAKTAAGLPLVNNGKPLPCYYMTKIKCPRHWIVKPGLPAYQMEIDPAIAKLPKWAQDHPDWKLRKYRKKKDRWGRPIPEPKNYYQPEISAAFAIEHIYDPLNPICSQKCKGRCLEGKGKLNLNSIRRLRG